MTRVRRRLLHLKVAWLLMLITCLAVSVLSHASAQSADEAALRTLAEKFFAAYTNADLDGVMRLWSAQSPDLDQSKQTFQQTFATNKFELKSLTIRKISMENAKAAVRVVADIIASDAKTEKPVAGSGIMNRTLHCVKEGEAWKLWQYVSSEQELALALAAAKTNEERKALLEVEKELVTVELVKAMLAQGRRLLGQGNYQLAFDIYALTMDVADQVHDKNGTVTALRGIGAVHYSRGNYAQALEYYQKSLRIAEEIDNKEGIARALNNIGIVHDLQGNYAQALEYYQRSLKIAEDLHDQAGKADTLNNIGIVYRLQGNYAQALEYYQRSLRISEAIDYKIGLASTLNSIGIVHDTQGNYAQALAYYQKSLEIKEGMDDKEGIARTLNNIGLVHSTQGNYAQALEYYQRSLRIKEEIDDKAGMSDTLISLGLLGDLQGNYAQALEYFQTSLKIKNEIGDMNGIVGTMISIAAVYFSQANYTQAIEVADRAAAMAEQIGLPEVLWQARSTTGKAFRALNRPDQARHAFELAIASIERLRSQVAGSEQDRERFFEDKLAPYHQMIQLLIEQNNLTEAFAYAERAKARALLDILQIGRMNITKAMTGDEQELERQRKSEMVSLNVQLYREKVEDQPDPARLAQLNARLEKARRDYEAFDLSLYAGHPELKIYRGQMQPIRLGQSAELITNASTALLEYVVTEDRTYLFVLTGKPQPKGNDRSASAVPILNAYTLNIKLKDLADRVELFRKLIASTDIRFRKPAHELFELLLKPAADQLRGKSRLVVVPDGPLWELPFQTLQADQNRYLIENHSIAYAPSFTALREMIKRRDKAPPTSSATTLLALGNPLLGKATVATVKKVFMNESFDDLPEAAKQVEALGQLYGVSRSKIYIGAQASEERFKAEAPSYRILHLATHGILDDRNPMYSHLLLSQKEGDEKEDGLLEAWELMRLDLKADMAVLSACETARGRAARGEGIIGLSWALFVAGVPTTVVSQWKVESASTAELMVEFHRQLKSKVDKSASPISKAEALRQAALKLLRNKQYSHPFYWGGFVVVGDGF